MNLLDKKWVVFDVECDEDVDGKRNQFNMAQHLGVAVACTLTHDGEYRDWIGAKNGEAHRLLGYLSTFDVVVGYNLLGFDYPLLGGCVLGEYHLAAPKVVEAKLAGKTVDLCLDFKEAIGQRVSLQNVAVPTLGQSKTMDGGLAPTNWRKGKCLEVISYCRVDLDLTGGLFRKAVAGEPLFVLAKDGAKKQFSCQPKLR